MDSEKFDKRKFDKCHELTHRAYQINEQIKFLESKRFEIKVTCYGVTFSPYQSLQNEVAELMIKRLREEYDQIEREFSGL